MRKFLYIFGAFVVFNVAMFGINTYREWCGPKPVAVVVAEQSAVSAPVSVGQKTNQQTYRVAFRVSPAVQSSVKPQ